MNVYESFNKAPLLGKLMQGMSGCRNSEWFGRFPTTYFRAQESPGSQALRTGVIQRL